MKVHNNKMWLAFDGDIHEPVSQVKMVDRAWPCICGGIVRHSPIEGGEFDGNTLGVCEDCEQLFHVQELEMELTCLWAAE